LVVADRYRGVRNKAEAVIPFGDQVPEGSVLCVAEPAEEVVSLDGCSRAVVGVCDGDQFGAGVVGLSWCHAHLFVLSSP